MTTRTMKAITKTHDQGFPKFRVQPIPMRFSANNAGSAPPSLPRGSKREIAAQVGAALVARAPAHKKNRPRSPIANRGRRSANPRELGAQSRSTYCPLTLFGDPGIGVFRYGNAGRYVSVALIEPVTVRCCASGPAERASSV